MNPTRPTDEKNGRTGDGVLATELILANLEGEVLDKWLDDGEGRHLELLVPTGVTAQVELTDGDRIVRAELAGGRHELSV